MSKVLITSKIMIKVEEKKDTKIETKKKKKNKIKDKVEIDDVEIELENKKIPIVPENKKLENKKIVSKDKPKKKRKPRKKKAEKKKKEPKVKVPTFECILCYEDCPLDMKSSCPICNATSCVKCIKNHIKYTDGMPHCFDPRCKSEWDRIVCINNTNLSFFNKTVRGITQQSLFEMEKAQIPAILEYIEPFKRLFEIDELFINGNGNRTLRDERTTLLDELDIKKKKKTKVNQALRRCPVGKCEGFLSHWKCTLCKVRVCAQCLEVREKDHKCLEANLESAKMIKKETRACPKCFIPIFKVSGCDQMWCTDCKTPFSWRTGQIVKGRIHNPHFYEWKRQRQKFATDNGINLNNPDAANAGGAATANAPAAAAAPAAPVNTCPNHTNEECGGLCDVTKLISMFSKLEFKYKGKPNVIKYITYISKLSMNMHRLSLHSLDNHLTRLRTEYGKKINNRIMRLKYASNIMTEMEFKRQLYIRHKRRQALKAQLDIFELLNSLTIERINNLAKDEIEIEKLVKNIQEIESIRIYFNKEMIKIGYYYEIPVMTIPPRWNIYSDMGLDSLERGLECSIRRILKRDLNLKHDELNYSDIYKDYCDGGKELEI